ncbi:MAG: GNAT family N-acetyltransferase [Bacteroidales bacterium]|nr:MAG: GNAT family N-acetyltransferase [Bacteroidales bacterium]
MASFSVLNLSNKLEWNRLLKQLPIEQQDIYYTQEYHQVYEVFGDGKAMCLVYEKDHKLVLYPFLLNSVTDLGYNLDKNYFDTQSVYGYSGLTGNTEDSDFIDEFYSSFGEYCLQNNIIAGFTRFHPIISNQRLAPKHINILKDRLTVVVDLTKSYNDIWTKDYSSSNRNMIRKAKKNGYKIEIKREPNRKDIEEFIDIYRNSMQKVEANSYYFFNKDYFFNIFNILKGRSYLINVLNLENEAICSSIFFHYNHYFHYHLSGRKDKADNSANIYLLDQAITFAISIGAKYFHFGGGRTSSSDDSLLKFKQSFSKMTLPFHIGKKIYNQKVYDEVVKQWELKYPEKKDKYSGFLLKYRY